MDTKEHQAAADDSSWKVMRILLGVIILALLGIAAKMIGLV
jgi:hypothetical protein